jgi:hypothetical protein
MSNEKRDREPVPPKSVRVRELFSRLERHRPFSSFEEAYAGLVAVLEALEDELSGAPNNPQNWRTDGRLYPPQQDNWFRVPGHPGVVRMRTRSHNVYIAANGAMEARSTTSDLLDLDKPGSDGRKVWDE